MDDDKVIPDVDFNDPNHKFIWDVYGYKLTDADFEAIEKIILERKEDHAAIDKTERMLIPFGKKMYQPRDVPDFMRQQAHDYVNWSAGCDIFMILSKYVDIYSKKKW